MTDKKAQKNLYGDLDLSNLDFLEHGDFSRIAEKLNQEKGLNVNRFYISMVKRQLVKNGEVMAELLKLGGQRRKKLNQAIA